MKHLLLTSLFLLTACQASVGTITQQSSITGKASIYGTITFDLTAKKGTLTLNTDNTFTLVQTFPISCTANGKFTTPDPYALSGTIVFQDSGDNCVSTTGTWVDSYAMYDKYFVLVN